MKTYAETKDEKPFNWLSWLNHVRYNASLKSLDEKRELAGDWPTCACGNMCDVIPRRNDGTPLDDTLDTLGYHFFKKIDAMHTHKKHNSGKYLFNTRRKEAISIFHQIEQRSCEILKEMGYDLSEAE